MAAALTGGSALLTRLWLPNTYAAAVGVAVGVVSGVWVARGLAALQAGDERRRVLAAGVWSGHRGGLPRVQDLDDPVVLGVHPALAGAGSVAGRCPVFVVREVCTELRRVLLQDRFVLLVGESTAGKSRLAYELIRAEVPRFVVVCPSHRETVLAAAELAGGGARSVLWLDDLERFLGPGGLTGAAIGRLLASRGRRYVVATIRSNEYAKFSARSLPGADGGSGDALRQAWDVLRLATRVEVPRMWPPSDVGRARLCEDGRLAEAVRHAEQYGVAEYLAAAPQLLAEWRDAWSVAAHPRAATMVLAAVDARRAGIHRPLERRDLLRLHEPYLQRRGGARLRPESAEDALAWATAPLHATSSLLIPAANGFLAFDYLIDAADKDRPPGDAIEVLISIATPSEALSIGMLAWDWSLTAQADTAFCRAEAGWVIEATAARCELIGYNRDGHTTALRMAREAAGRVAAEFGPDDSRTLEASSLVAWWIGIGGDPLTSRRMYGELAAHASRVLGDDDIQTLQLRDGIARMTGMIEPADAARQYEVLAGECCSALGEDHEQAIRCRAEIARWLAAAGEPAAAADRAGALLTDMTTRYRSTAHAIFPVRCQRARYLTNAGEYQAALSQWADLAEMAAAIFGRLHSSSLSVRVEQAWCCGESGNPAEATALLQSVLVDTNTLGDTELSITLYIRQSIAWWIGESGDIWRALHQLCQLAKETVKRFGDDDPEVRVLYSMITYWEVMESRAADATDLLQQNVASLSRYVSQAHPVIRACYREIARHQQA